MVIPELLKDKYTLGLFASSLAILVITFFAAYVNLWGVGNLLIIHSDVFRGADFFGNFGDVFGIIAVAAVVLILNAILAQGFYFKERFLSYLLAFSTFVFMVLILTAVGGIISSN